MSPPLPPPTFAFCLPSYIFLGVGFGLCLALYVLLTSFRSHPLHHVPLPCTRPRRPPPLLHVPLPDPLFPSWQALAQHAVERDVARSVKTAFDAAYGPAWHCVVGRDYGSYVTHEVGAFVYFFVGGWSVLLFRAGWVGSEGGGAEGGGDEGGSSAR